MGVLLPTITDGPLEFYVFLFIGIKWSSTILWKSRESTSAQFGFRTSKSLWVLKPPQSVVGVWWRVSQTHWTQIGNWISGQLGDKRPIQIQIIRREVSPVIWEMTVRARSSRWKCLEVWRCEERRRGNVEPLIVIWIVCKRELCRVCLVNKKQPK